jgi:hypothetical protein
LQHFSGFAFYIDEKKSMDVIKTLGASHIAGRLCISRELLRSKRGCSLETRLLARNAVARSKRGCSIETRLLDRNAVARNDFPPLCTGTDLRKKFHIEQIDDLSQVILFLVAVDGDGTVLGTYETIFRFVSGAGFTADTAIFKSIVEKFSAKEGDILSIAPASNDMIRNFKISVPKIATANAIVNIMAEEVRERTETRSEHRGTKRSISPPPLRSTQNVSKSVCTSLPPGPALPPPRGMDDVWNAFSAYRQNIRYLLGGSSKEDVSRKMELDMIYEMIACEAVTREVAIGLIDRITSNRVTVPSA